MKKILFLIDSLAGGGAEKVLVKILELLNTEDYQIDIFLINKEGIYLKQIETKHKIYALFGERKDINIVLIKKAISLYRILKSKIFFKYPYFINRALPSNYDVEVAFLEGRTTHAVANRVNQAKKVAWIHTDLEKHRGNIKEDREAYKRIDEIVCVSQGSYESVKRIYPEYQNKIKIIYNPIDMEEIRHKAEEDLWLNRDTVNVVTVGRLVPAKGYDILLKAHKELIEEGIQYNLLILGEGEERSRFEEYIRNNNLEDTVKLVGFKENPYPYMKQADIFLMSSRYEGYPLVLCEAIVLGKPIIATKCTGILEILEQGKYGMMADCESVESLKACIKNMVVNEKIREDYMKLSSERAEIFNIDSTMNKIKTLLEE